VSNEITVVQNGPLTHPLVEAGRATRFQPGNRAAIGRGRPRKEVSEVYDALSRRGLGELWLIATDPEHPLHSRHGFEALAILVKLTTPKRVIQIGLPAQTSCALNVDALFPGRRDGPT